MQSPIRPPRADTRRRSSHLPRRGVCAALVAALVSALVPPAVAQAPLVIPRVTGRVTLDGRFDEDAWTRARSLPLVGYLPVTGASPSESTVVRVMHDTRALYVAAELYDRDPEGVQDWSRGRDTDVDGDFINVVIDAYADRENAVVFSTTPSGARLDYAVSNDAEGDTPSSISWNGFWDVRVRRDRTGWFAEFRIPFSTLRYQPTGEQVHMGLIVNRRIGRRSERVIFPAIEPRWSFGMFKPSRAQPVVIEGVERQRERILVPYVVAGRHRDATEPLASGDAAEPRFDAGGDLKLALSNNLNLDATINTDFAETDVDDERINLGRYPIAQPERRQFFLERAGIFDFRFVGDNQLLTTRRIGLTADGRRVPLYGGVRLVGRLGGADLGLLSMQSRRAAGEPTANFSVLRVRSRVFNEESYLGAMATTRASAADGEAAGGVDAVVRLGGPHYVRVAAAMTGPDTASGGSVPWRDRTALRAQLERRSTIGLGGQVGVLWLGTGFSPPIGFVESAGIRRADARVGFGVPGPGRSGVRLVTPSLRVLGTDLTSGAPQTRVASAVVTTELRSGAVFVVGVERRREILREELPLADEFIVAPGDYAFTTVTASGGTPPTAAGSVAAQLSAGGIYGGRRRSATVSGVWHPVPILTATAEYVHERLSRETATATLRLARLRAAVAPSARHSGAATVQYSTTTHLMAVNARWRVNFREATDLWVVYDHVLNQQRERVIPPLPATARQSLLLKVTYALTN